MGEHGTTLLELIVVIAIAAVLVGFVSNVIYHEVNIYDSVSARKRALQDSRVAMQMMARDLRQIMAPDSIFQVSADSIRFDLVGDLMITYEFSGGQVLRNGDLLLDSVNSFQFAYYDDSATLLDFPINDPTEIRSISLSFSTSVEGETIASQFSVTPRNY